MENTKIYKSKIGLELVVPVVIILGGTSLIMIYQKVWPGLIINLSVIVFLWYTLKTTMYTIKDNKLLVRCGFFVNEAIKIESIKKVSETKNMISSAAASLDRLEILYNKFDSILISPKEKMKFIEHLLSINPAIQIKLKAQT